jgi:hypothetical protein
LTSNCSPGAILLRIRSRDSGAHAAVFIRRDQCFERARQRWEDIQNALIPSRYGTRILAAEYIMLINGHSFN